MNVLKNFLGYLCLVVALQANAGIITGKVVSVADGDTITVLDAENNQHKIRLMGIDAPEKSQPFGQASKKNLSNLVFAKTVTVEWLKRDRYKRVIGKVLFEKMDVCLEQVKSGFAWHYKQYEREQLVDDRSLYANAEVSARKERVGLWADADPVEPSKYRNKK